jgi:hypothetical protein
MEKQIEKAIRETLVISNPQSIHLAVKKYCFCWMTQKKVMTMQTININND